MIKSRFLPCWFKLSIQAWFTWLLAYDEVQICTRSHPGTYWVGTSFPKWISWTIPLRNQRWKQAQSRERPTHLQPSVKYTDTINKTKAALNDRVMSSGGQLQLQLRTPRTAPLTRHSVLLRVTAGSSSYLSSPTRSREGPNTRGGQI